VDPLQLTLEVFRLQAGSWAVDGLFQKDDRVRANPFEDLELALSDLWTPAST